MKTSKKIQSFLDDSNKRESYWAENAKIEFAVTLEKQRKDADMAYVDIANKIGKSPAYVSKVFRGDSNLTIESMVMLARAVKGHLNIEISDGATNAFLWAEFMQLKSAPQPSNNSQFATEWTMEASITNLENYSEAA